MTSPTVRFYWAPPGPAALFFRRLPGDGRIDACADEFSGQAAPVNPGIASEVISMSACGNCSASSSTV